MTEAPYEAQIREILHAVDTPGAFKVTVDQDPQLDALGFSAPTRIFPTYSEAIAEVDKIWDDIAMAQLDAGDPVTTAQHEQQVVYATGANIGVVRINGVQIRDI